MMNFMEFMCCLVNVGRLSYSQDTRGLCQWFMSARPDTPVVSALGAHKKRLLITPSVSGGQKVAAEVTRVNIVRSSQRGEKSFIQGLSKGTGKRTLAYSSQILLCFPHNRSKICSEIATDIGLHMYRFFW